MHNVTYPPSMQSLTTVYGEPLDAAWLRIPSFQSDVLDFLAGDPYPGPFASENLSKLDEYMLQADARSFTALP